LAIYSVILWVPLPVEIFGISICPVLLNLVAVLAAIITETTKKGHRILNNAFQRKCLEITGSSILKKLYKLSIRTQIYYISSLATLSNSSPPSRYSVTSGQLSWD
jgi:hypothetical protein